MMCEKRKRSDSQNFEGATKKIIKLGAHISWLNNRSKDPARAG
jgi:hypothetical protein